MGCMIEHVRFFVVAFSVTALCALSIPAMAEGTGDADLAKLQAEGERLTLEKQVSQSDDNSTEAEAFRRISTKSVTQNAEGSLRLSVSIPLGLTQGDEIFPIFQIVADANPAPKPANSDSTEAEAFQRLAAKAISLNDFGPMMRSCASWDGIHVTVAAALCTIIFRSRSWRVKSPPPLFFGADWESKAWSHLTTGRSRSLAVAAHPHGDPYGGGKQRRYRQ